MKMLEKKLVELGDDEIRQLIEELEKVGSGFFSVKMLKSIGAG